MKVPQLRGRIHLPRKYGLMRWGVAGCGKFLESAFLPTLKQNKRNRLVSVYSSSIIRAKEIAEKFSAENFHNNFQEFLKEDFDAIYISSKNSDHYWQVIEAAKAGKNILCEKPLALDSTQIKEMIEVCKQNNVKLAVNYVYRFHPLVVKAKELIDKQLLGKIIFISANYNVNYAPNDNFRFTKSESGGGALRDIGTHMIDLLTFLGGNVSKVKGFVGNVLYSGEVDDDALGVIKFEEGNYGYFNVSFNCQKAPNRIEIVGYKGTITIEKLVSNRNGTAKIIIDIHGEARKAFRKRANKLGMLLKAVQKSFANNEEPTVNGDVALKNMLIMEELESQCRLEKN
ncbi:MAG: Gfo/Idh/MocA family oxidoreductase [Ignavibacteriales bacterium]